MYYLLNTNAVLIISETAITAKKITVKDRKTELTVIKLNSVDLYAVAMYSSAC